MSAPAGSVEVVAAVFRRDGRFLACRRREGLASAGRWEFPGGKVEHGETAQSALVREIREELSVTVRVLDLLDRTSTDIGSRVIDLACYHVESDESPRQSHDHDRLEWVRPTEMVALDWAAPDLPAVARLTSL